MKRWGWGDWMTWLVVVLLLFIFQIMTILLSEFRHPPKAVAWLMVLFILPVIGFVMYYFLAKEYTRRRKVKRKNRMIMKEIRRDLIRLSRKPNQDRVKLEIEEDHRLYGLLRSLPDSFITKCNDATIYTNAEPTYRDMLEAMEAATDHIHLEYYTIRDDGIGREFQRVMMRKAREGVEVRLLYDGVGSIELTDSYIEALEEAGVKTACFLPPLIALVDKRINYRNHRKTLIVDGTVGFLGGINIGDEYLGKDPKLGYWRDTHLRIVGDSVYYLQHTFLNDWYFVKGVLLHAPQYFPEHECEGHVPVQIVTSGPDANWDTILEVYFSAIAAAKHRVFITTPYFVPEPSVIMALKTAAVSGVDVRIILPAVPDTRIVYWASLSYIEELLQAGVRFYLYEKGFIHAKTLLADHKLATVGTANMDMRSFFDNFELNAVLFDRKTIDRLERDFMTDLKSCREVQLSEWEQRSRWQRGKEKLARLLAPLF